MKIRFLGALAVGMFATSSFAQMSPADARPYCREFTQKVIINGQPQMSYGTSCRQPDGSWQIVPEAPNAPESANIPPQAVPYSPTYVVAAPPVYYSPYYAPYPYAPYPYAAYPRSSVNIGVGFGGGYGGGYGGHPWRR